MRKKNPVVFVVGPPRSGTTLLVRMLTKHQPAISGISYESQFYAWKKHTPFRKEAYQKNAYFQRLIGEENIASIFDQSENHVAFMQNAINYCMQDPQKKLFVEKSPVHTLFFNQIIQDFSEARFVLIMRDVCANVHSIANTSWISLFTDRFPSFIRNHKTLRYLAAILAYDQYYRACNLIAQMDECVVSLRYEDIVNEEIPLQEILSNALNVPLDDLFVSRPFSDQTNQRAQAFDKSRLDGYKTKMPGWIQKLIRMLFEPQKGKRKWGQNIIRVFFLSPVYRLRRQ